MFIEYEPKDKGDYYRYLKTVGFNPNPNPNPNRYLKAVYLRGLNASKILRWDRVPL